MGSDAPIGTGASDSLRGRNLLSNLLRLPADRFEADFWLRKPYRLQLTPAERESVRLSPRHPAHMLPIEDVKALLFRTEPRPARWLHDVDSTKWDGARRTAQGGGGDGPVRDPAACWSNFEKGGYSIRMVMPQQWHKGAYVVCPQLSFFSLSLCSPSVSNGTRGHT